MGRSGKGLLFFDMEMASYTGLVNTTVVLLCEEGMEAGGLKVLTLQ